MVVQRGHHKDFVLYRQKLGEHIPLIRRQDVKGFITRRRSWIVRNIRPEKAREEAALMEMQSRRFYEAAARCTYLISNFHTATMLAIVVVIVELAAIS